ncbi:hypothetical protein CEXT_685131 [Caerostris extrusa]|uniref:Secreted protein n=1 Tax=Caerostris extrusa TaxID=172846 RepID=A0AAV4V0I0_CAEEX|nr:hypothetical protein CEXT_685131 [Caerostris extrusa]
MSHRNFHRRLRTLLTFSNFFFLLPSFTWVVLKTEGLLIPFALLLKGQSPARSYKNRNHPVLLFFFSKVFFFKVEGPVDSVQRQGVFPNRKG